MKSLSSPIRIALSVFIIGAIFKILHWPGSNIMLLISGVALIILYPMRFFAKKAKTTLDYIKLIFVLSWALDMVANTTHYFQSPIPWYITTICFIAWVLLEGIAYFDEQITSEKQQKLFKLNRILFFIGVVLLAFATTFKVMHWPGANILLLSGGGFIVFLILKGIGKKEESASPIEEGV